MLRHIVGFLGKILNLIKTKIMKNKKIRIAGYVFAGTLVAFSAFSVFAANWTAPSRLDLAEAAYKEATDQRDYWADKQKETRCNLISIKIEEHVALKLKADDLQRLSGLLAECEGEK